MRKIKFQCGCPFTWSNKNTPGTVLTVILSSPSPVRWSWATRATDPTWVLATRKADHATESESSTGLFSGSSSRISPLYIVENADSLINNFDNSVEVWRLLELEAYTIIFSFFIRQFSFSYATWNPSCWALFTSHVLPAILKTIVAEMQAADSAQQDRSNTQMQFLYVEQWSRIKFKYFQSLSS